MNSGIEPVAIQHSYSATVIGGKCADLEFSSRRRLIAPQILRTAEAEMHRVALTKRSDSSDALFTPRILFSACSPR